MTIGRGKPHTLTGWGEAADGRRQQRLVDYAPAALLLQFHVSPGSLPPRRAPHKAASSTSAWLTPHVSCHSLGSGVSVLSVLHGAASRVKLARPSAWYVL